MEHIFNLNGLVVWSANDIRRRNYLTYDLAAKIENILRAENNAWKFIQIEAPLLTPRSLINKNYTNEDIWVQENLNSQELVLRPETTPGSYEYAKYLLESNKQLPPLCVWQLGKSFRREIEQPLKHMRLKEFYQQEFQCIYTADTKNDYHQAILEPMANLIKEHVALPTRIVPSDRLPSYSLKTMDIEVNNGDKWMEVCSISLRTDFPIKATFNNNKGKIEKDLLVLEIAIGIDRLIYNIDERFFNS